MLSSNVAVGLQRILYSPSSEKLALIILRVALVPTFPAVGVKLTPQSPPAQLAPSTVAGEAATPSMKARVRRHINLVMCLLHLQHLL